jgi:hypothetical protein
MVPALTANMRKATEAFRSGQNGNIPKSASGAGEAIMSSITAFMLMTRLQNRNARRRSSAGEYSGTSSAIYDSGGGDGGIILGWFGGDNPSSDNSGASGDSCGSDSGGGDSGGDDDGGWRLTSVGTA